MKHAKHLKYVKQRGATPGHKVGTETIPAQGKRPAIKFKAGGLHASTGTPPGKPIPAAKKAAARAGKLGVKAERQAIFAANILVGRRRGKNK